MARDHEPARDYAAPRGITFRERVGWVVEIVRQVPAQVRGIFDGLRMPAESGQGPERKVEDDPEAALRRARGRAVVRHARAVDAIFAAQDKGGRASPDQFREMREARQRVEEVRPYGLQDAEAAYQKNQRLAAEAACGDARRAIRALQPKTERRTEPLLRADRFVERRQSLHKASDERYAAGDHAGHRAARAEMGNMAHSLEHVPQRESLLAGRKREFGIALASGMGGGRDLTLGLGRGRGLRP
jgi:hypothetical protein